MDDPDDETVLRYTVDTDPALYDEDDGRYDGPFVGNTTATRFTVGPDVTEIGGRTFMNCSRISSLQGMGEGVTKIGKLAFNGCPGLVTLQGMGKNVTEIGEQAFQFCEGLTSLRGIPESVTAIARQAFLDCSGLTSLEGLPCNLSAINFDRVQGVFGRCHGLTSLQGLPKNITALGVGCFSTCAGITSLQGGESVTMIGGGAFLACDALTTLQGLSRNVTAIGDPDAPAYYPGAFLRCTSLVSIGPGLSPSCFVHPRTFDHCDALLAAAEAKGFTSVIEWGRHQWLAVPRRRFTVLTAVRQVRRSPPSANFSSPLLSLLVDAPDDMVRVIVGFMGEGEFESDQEEKARWKIMALKQRERAERLEEGMEQQREQIEQQRGEMKQQRQQMEERVERLEELLKRELEGRGADEGDRRVRQKREE